MNKRKITLLTVLGLSFALSFCALLQAQDVKYNYEPVPTFQSIKPTSGSIFRMPSIPIK